MAARTFKRRPDTVKAIQFTGLDTYLDVVNWVRECDIGTSSANVEEMCRFETPIMFLRTPRGTVAVEDGDWVVLGDGEFYVCDGAFFDAMYVEA